MKLFSTDQRERIKTQIIDFCKSNESILSLVLVGSGAVGFTDDISDLDFYLIVDHEENMSDVMDYVKENIEKYNSSLFFQQMNMRKLQVYLLDNYLEIDIGYSVLSEAAASKERFKVIFDKTDTVEILMKESWQNIKDKQHLKSSSADIREKFKEYADDTFHYLFHAAAAIKREQYWRCVTEMEIVRNRIIEIKGYKYSFETKRFRNVDNFPKDELVSLQRTLVSELTHDALLQNLLCLVDLSYTEFESHFGNDIIVNRAHVMEYISDIMKVGS